MSRRQVLLYASLFVLMLAMYAWHAWFYLRKRRLRRQLAEEGRLPPKAPRRRADVASTALVVLLIAIGIAVFWLERRYGVKVMTPRSMLLGGAAVFVVVFAFVFLRIRQQRDPVVREALGLEERGDAAGAVERLRAAMAEAPTAERAEVLGGVLNRQERWEEAAAAFREAGRLDPQRPLFPINLALSLSKGGKGEQALEAIREARARAPHEAAYAAAEALVLAGLGRADEAAEQLRQSEELAIVAESDQRVDLISRGALVMACREALSAAGSTRAFPVTQAGPSVSVAE
jgi:hypothetical protein